MNGKTISSDFPRALSIVSRLFWFVTRQRLKLWLLWVAALVSLFLCAFIEFRTSILQSWFFTSTNTRLHFSLGEGPTN